MLNPSCTELHISVMLLDVFSNETFNPAPIVFFNDIRVPISPQEQVFLNRNRTSTREDFSCESILEKLG